MPPDGTQAPPITISRTSTASVKVGGNQGSQDQEVTVTPDKQPPRLNTRRPYGRAHVHWLPTSKRGEPGRPRRRSPDVEWRIKWSDDCFTNGRVLIIDYISNDAEHNLDSPPTPGSKRHVAVASAECQHIEDLERFYSEPQRARSAALRVIHVQNATWATRYLLKKFNIDHPSDLVGMQAFSNWVQVDRPRQRHGRPFPEGRSFREKLDPFRNISRTAFGLDYLKVYATPAPDIRRRRRAAGYGNDPIEAKMMHLHAYEDGTMPYGSDVSVQRLSVYVQRNLGPPGRVSPDEEIRNPYKHYGSEGRSGPKVVSDDDPLPFEDLDNTNTVIIFESSASAMLEDCVIQPRAALERQWRRLSFYLRKDEALHDSRLAAQCTSLILSDIFHGLAVVWEEFLTTATDHVNLLEERIYENPADESRAPELWTNQAEWLRVDKIMWMHQDVIKEMQGHMRDLADEVLDGDGETQSVQVLDWLAGTPAEYEKLAHGIAEDLVQPTTNLSDLMYKSVGIRDSRQSLQLSTSLWRLSWITFIFLPLTFISGFFSMNVQELQSHPSIGWYALAACSLMILVLTLWYCVKHSLQRRRQTPYQRGLYEQLFTQLEDEYPALWTASLGAADDVEPTGWISGLKWRMLKRWFAPEKTINKRTYSTLVSEGGTEELDGWDRFKRYLLMRWLPQLRRDDGAHLQHEADDVELGRYRRSSRASRSSLHNHQNGGAFNRLADLSTMVAMADAEPAIAPRMWTYGLQPLFTRRSQSGTRSGSRGSSGIVVEERNLSDSESEGGEQRHHDGDLNGTNGVGGERGRRVSR